jgi:dTDP-4-amino-4,6-dideoxygalactose transaminase
MKKKSLSTTTELLCQLTGRNNAVLAGRATAGIMAALRVWGIENEWVLLPANICYIVLWGVLQTGNYPVLIDVDPETANISMKSLLSCNITNPAAIIVTHMYGLGAPIAAIMEWAQRTGTRVIEDATLALGANVDGRPAGSWGELSVLSFGSGKIIDIGLGGALLSDDPVFSRSVEQELGELPAWSKRLEELNRQWLEIYWAFHQFEDVNKDLLTLYPGLYQIYNPLTGFQVPESYWDRLLKPLRSLPTNLDRRRKMTSILESQLAGLPIRKLVTPNGSILWKYPLLVSPNDRNHLLDYLWQQDVGLATRWYPSIRIMLKALGTQAPDQETPGADRLAAEIINLCIDSNVDIGDTTRTAGIIKSYFLEKYG